MEKTKNRELLPDVLRGFAIFLVVFGHCIQEGNGIEFRTNTMYFSDKVYQFIYSFHMPLFMMISGYFAWDSMERVNGTGEKWKLLGKRCAVLVMPILGWTCFEHICIWLEQGRAYVAFWSIPLFIKYFSLRLLSNVWFLWAVFWCFLIVFFMHFYFKDSRILYMIGFLLLFVIPDGLGLGAYKYMMPYFIAAFYYRGWQKQERDSVRKYLKYPQWLNNSSDWTWIGLFGILFIGLFLLFNENSFIYLSGYKLIGKNVVRQLGIDFYRTIIGFVGAVFFILLFRKLLRSVPNYRFPIFSALGKNSLGIYMISGYLTIQLDNVVQGSFKPNYLLNSVQAVVIIGVSFVLTLILKKIPLLRWVVGR
ncbi:MAG: acyltransferase [Lachnospiraceae bacterium]|nr:acyltransferase [Lachnospiraceae bacterium]